MDSSSARRSFKGRNLVWLVALTLFVLLWQFGETLFAWAFEYPGAYEIPLRYWIRDFMNWLLDDAGFGLFSFTEMTRFIADVIDFPYRVALSLLSTGFLEGQGSDAVQVVPPLSWVAIIGIIAMMGLYAGGVRLALLVAGCFGFIALFGQWDSAMVTLASILIAVPIGIVGGLLLGILGYRSRGFERAITPILDLMQTIPVFAYLVPILFLFGFSPTAAIVATIIYALPPMTRISIVSLRSVPPEIKDLGRMIGCTRRQMTWRVLVPSARPGLMVGVNQVIMLSLNMVIIASMIGAGGLGYEVLAALRRLDIGTGFEAGFAIVALAIALDRLSQAYAARSRQHSGDDDQQLSVWRRYPYSLSAVALIAVTFVLGLGSVAFQSYPSAAEISTGTFWGDILRWININFFDQLEGLKNALLLNLLIPFKRFLLDLPWLGVAALLALAGWSLGRWRLAATVAALAFLIAATGQWEKAMITVYLCGISVVLAGLIGIPIGILSAERERVWRFVRVIIDTLQTLPSFVYLMPAVMLFRVGDFTAMLAVIAYAISPAIRYTAHGLQRIDPQLVEAGTVAGCTPIQLLLKIKLKLALPAIMLGLNQTIMLALSMLVITALVGTRDLGQEVYIALTKADTGRGLVSGLAVAFIAIIADRLISAGAAKTRARLGLSPGAGDET
ncbi:ABC transporter permease [Limibacillus halophilus]|uniref:Glycine betaine/proline transport system permease protein n=1 Tax=Limibacillus halophilus TaxID=1579333 RepID=A0A839SV95_9PROT|nr:ABC transporter permease subunit [Limibacillus halophilus]MBB3066238.1 glycine betaine/proline transport system permease protein [Limibacillus halophilus]